MLRQPCEWFNVSLLDSQWFAKKEKWWNHVKFTLMNRLAMDDKLTSMTYSLFLPRTRPAEDSSASQRILLVRRNIVLYYGSRMAYFIGKMPITFIDYITLKCNYITEIWVCAARPNPTRPDPVTLLRSLYLWNGLTDSRAVFFVRCRH